NALDQLVKVTLPSSCITYQYGYDGLRTSASDTSGASQIWFSATTTERNGKREHYVQAGDRVIAKVVLDSAAAGSGGVSAVRRLVPPVIFWTTLLGFALCGLAALGATLVRPLRQRRRRVWASLALSALLPGCWSGGQARVESLTWAASETTYFH